MCFLKNIYLVAPGFSCGKQETQDPCIGSVES